MGQQVPATYTPVAESQAVAYLTVALTLALKQNPPEQIGVYTLALAWIETGAGQSLIQNNPGNMSCYADGRDWSGDYWRPPWFDSTDPKYAALHERMLNGQAPSAFRAYPTQEAGWAAFVHEVVRRKGLLAAMMADDPLAVVRALRGSGYSADYRDEVAKSFASLVKAFRSRGAFAPYIGVELDGLPSASTAPPAAPKKVGGGGGGGAVLALLAAVGAAGAYFLSKKRRK